MSTYTDNEKIGTILTNNIHPLRVQSVQIGPYRSLIEKVLPYTDDHVISLSDRNSGYVIDGTTPIQSYMVSLSSNINVGDRWVVHVSADRLSLVNDTGRDLYVSGFIYTNDYGISHAETTYPPGYVREEGEYTRALYDITVTSVTPTTVDTVYAVTYTKPIIV